MTELLNRIVDVRDEKKRDTVIEQVGKLLDERDVLKQSILVLEQEFKVKLKIFMSDIRTNISEQQKKKVSAHAYMDPYNKVYRDGIFFDNKN